MSVVETVNAGPIEGTFKIDLSDGPGVYELRGYRGSGKSTVLAAVDLLSGHRVDVTLHDGELNGHVSGFGVVAPIGSRKRRKGEFELDIIDAEKFTPTDLIDPPGKTPETRDRHAIKALAALSGVDADPKLYFELVGGEKEFASLGIKDTDDPVVLATRIKDAFDTKARIAARQAEIEADHAKALELVPDGLDMKSSADLVELGEARDKARDDWIASTKARLDGIDLKQKIESAKAKLASTQAEYKGKTVEEAKHCLGVAENVAKTARTEVERIEAELLEARSTLRRAQELRSAEDYNVQLAESHQQTIDALREQAEAENSYPTEAEVAKTTKAKDAAVIAYEIGVRVRDVRQNLEKAKAHREAEAKATKLVAIAKNKAADVFAILARSLKTEHISIEPIDGEPRLIVQHPKRGKCKFDRTDGLSDGERVDYALRELLPHLGSPGMLPIPQRIWQDLQPSDRKQLHGLAAERGIYIIGAQVDDGDLRVESYRAREQ